MELASGTMVNANVRLTRPLGQGAMGEVWVAQHLTLHTEVAVKFITPELGGKNDEVLSRFEQEAALAAQIKSPHVVQTFDQGTMADGTPFIVMELLDGESLQELLDRSERVPPVAALQIVSQVARALSKAHKLGIVHRDIKPDNIFIIHSDDGIFCKILDFGIAKQTRLPKMGGLTHAGIMIGTPEYMSPEQVMSAKDVDGHADIWALAATTYQMLTGYLAFDGEAIGELCVKLLEGRYLAATELCPDLPAELDVFFKKAFQRNKDHRHQSARELARALYEVFPDANAEPMLDTLDSLDSTRPPPLAALPSHKLSTRPGVVTDVALDEDGEQPQSDAAIPQDVASPDSEMDSVGRPRRAGSATLNGSTANRPVPDEVSKRKVGGWVGIAVAAAVVLTVGGVGLMVALSGDVADQDASHRGTDLARSDAPAVPADDAAPAAPPALAVDDEADGVATAATPSATGSTAATAAARSGAPPAVSGASSVERRPPAPVRPGAPAAAGSSGVHRDHGF